MKWRKKPQPVPPITVDPEAAEQAVRHSKDALLEERLRTMQAMAVSESLRSHRARNHFAEMLAATMMKEQK